jgi:hypothetical protein
MPYVIYKKPSGTESVKAIFMGRGILMIKLGASHMLMMYSTTKFFVLF